MLSTIITVMAIAAPVHAETGDTVSNELSIEAGLIQSDDPNWDIFSDTGGLSTVGVRAGYGINSWLSVVGGWHHRTHDSEMFSEFSDYVELRLNADRFSVGAKANYELNSWIKPYATVQPMAVRGGLQIDEDGSDDYNINEYQFSDWSFGGLAALGVDVIPADPRNFLNLSAHLEAGYGLLQPLSFENSDVGNTAVSIGDLDFNGFYVQGGVGIRF